jgi:activating signal cointegrator 1
MLIPALTLRQPWASLVALGAKRIETRSWRTSYRGWLAIHAGMTLSKAERLLCELEPFRSALLRDTALDPALPLAVQLPHGSIIAIVWLDACLPMETIEWPHEPERSFGDYAPGRYAWYLSQVHRLPQPIPARGALGLWRVELPIAI